MIKARLKVSLSFWDSTWQNDYQLMANLNAAGIVLGDAKILQHRVIVSEVNLRKEWTDDLRKRMEAEIKNNYSNVEYVGVVKLD